MASGSNGDHNPRDRHGSRGQQPRGSGPGRPGAPDPRRSSGGEDVDFGAFVSERVRSASERLKGGEPSGNEPVTPRPTVPAQPQADEPGTPEPTPIRRRRPARYWRDSLNQPTEEGGEEPGESSQRFLGTGAQRRTGEERPAEAGGGGDDGDWWRRYVSSDDDGGNQRLILLALAALLILALLVFGLTRLIGGGDGDDQDAEVTPVPTVFDRQEEEPTEERVIATPTPASPTSPGDAPQPTETPEIRRGGDNQLDPSDGGDEEGTPGASRTDYESEVARACTGECLIRLTSDDATEVLGKTGNRPSFVGGDVAWAVVSADEAEELHGEADIALVADSAQTYNLYVITAAEGIVDPAVSSQYGDVVDTIGVHALVAFEEVPARISSLVDTGHQVHKLMPAPAESGPGDDRAALEDVDAQALMADVDAGNLEQSITDLVSIGELDDSGLGTRYYALPGNQIAADYLFQELESYGLEVWFEDFISWDGLLLVNIVAEAPGQDDSETYAVMSHFDSFNPEHPRQAPGADDNATGLAVNLETARILAGYDLEHPVRFVFVNAEEVGIQGALAWARQANASGVNVEGVLNVDSVGSARQGPYVVTNASESSSWLQDVMSEVNEEHGLGQTIQHMQDPEIIADDNMLRDEGIDAVMIARELYGWTPFHHTTNDTMANVSVDSVSSMTHLTLLTMVRLAA